MTFKMTQRVKQGEKPRMLSERHYILVTFTQPFLKR